MPTDDRPAPRTLRPGAVVNLVFLGVGVVLLGVIVARLDLHDVLARLRQVGAYFVLHCVFYVLGLMVTTAAWQQTIDPASSRARYRDLLAAFWVGHAINTLTPGATLGEVLKATIMRGKIDAEELVASLVTFNFMSTLSMLFFNLLGPALCLALLDLPRSVIAALFGLALVFFLPVSLVWLLLRLGAATRVVRIVSKLPQVRFKDPKALAARAEGIDQRIRRYRTKRPAHFRRAVGWFAAARLLQAAEYWALLLALLPARNPGWLFLVAVLTQASSQLMAWVLTFVPGQLGVAEGNSTALYQLLGLGSTIGFSLEVVRRMKTLVGVFIGLGIGWAIGLRPSGQHKIGASAAPGPAETGGAAP